jgi:hypothetical protein
MATGVVLLGERFAHIGAGRGERIDSCDGAHRHPLVQPAQGAREVAEGGVGGGIALDQEQHVAPGLQPGQHGLRGLQPGARQLLAVVRHGKQQRRVRRQRQPGAHHDVQRIAGRLGAAHRVDPDGVAALQRGPGRAGDQAGVARAQRDAVQGAHARGG